MFSRNTFDLGSPPESDELHENDFDSLWATQICGVVPDRGKFNYICGQPSQDDG